MKRDERGKIVEFGEFPQLESKRLILRQLTMHDAEFYLRNFSDPTTIELTCFEGPKDLEAAKEELREYCIDNFLNNTGIRWGITLKDNRTLIGTCGIYKWMKSHYHAEIGYDLLPEYRKRGIMTEAMTAAIDYIFGELGLNRIYAYIDPRNIASMALVERLGFVKEGRLRESTFFRGKFWDDVVYALVSRDWMKQ